MDLSRRDAIKAVVGTVALGALSGGATAQTASTDTQSVQEATFLLGNFEGSPNDVDALAPSGPFFEGADWQKTTYAYIIQNEQGEQYRIAQGQDRWRGLANLRVFGEIDIDALTTISGSGAAPTEVSDSAVLSKNVKTSMPIIGQLHYDGDVPVTKRVSATLSLSGANAQLAGYLAKNGSVVDRSEQFDYTPNASSPTNVVPQAVVTLEPGDYVSAFVYNVSGTADIDVERLALTL